MPTRKKKTYKKPTRKDFEPTKYPRENILQPGNTHEKNFWTHETHETHEKSIMQNEEAGTIFVLLFQSKNIIGNQDYRPIKILQFLTPSRIQKCLT